MKSTTAAAKRNNARVRAHRKQINAAMMAAGDQNDGHFSASLGREPAGAKTPPCYSTGTVPRSRSTLCVATRNNERSDAEYMAISGADYLRQKQSSGAQ